MAVLAVDFVSPWAVVAPYGDRARCGYRGDGSRASAPAPKRMRSAPGWRPHSTVGRDAHDGSVVVRLETPGFPRSALHVDLSEDATRLNVSGKLTRDGGKAPSPRTDGGDAAAADAPVSAAAPGGVAAEPAAPAPAGGAATAADGEVVKSFELSYRLPRDVDAGAISASYELAVLTVRVPKKTVGAESRTIPIQG